MTGTSSRLGAPIELPWWVVPLALPPALIGLAGLLIPGSLGGRVIAVVPAAILVWVVQRTARRVTSPSMQSVWISAAYGVWIVFPVAWIVLLLTANR